MLDTHPEDRPPSNTTANDTNKREGQTGLGASKRDQNVKAEEAQGIISFKVVRNDK